MFPMLFLIILAVLILLYLLLLRGCTGHKDLPELRKWSYAHRGLHSTGIPENSLAAFAAAKNAGYGMELDIHLMKDGNLAVIHDGSLLRTAGADVKIETLTAEELKNYRLEGTEEKIPLFTEVLELIRGEVPLIVELKSQVDNYKALCETACKQLDAYKGPYCIESFDPRCIRWLRKNRSDIVRGQLTQNYFLHKVQYPWVLQFALVSQIFNAFTKPDFVAYCFAERKSLSNFLCRKLWKMQGVAWTIRSREDFDTAINEGWIPIFENFTP